MSEYEARQALQELINKLQAKQNVRRGLLGDSNGTVLVANRPGWAYIRYHDDLNRLAIVRYLIPEQFPDGMPVVVGRKHPDSPYEEVLGVDWVMYATAPTETVVRQHATPAIDLSDLSPGKVVPTVAASLSVDVRAFLYINEDAAVEYGGGSIDLTGSVPGIAGHRLTLVYMDLDTDGLMAEDGAIVALAVNAAAPAVPENGLPLGLVDIANGDTSITGDDITQYKAMYQSLPPTTGILGYWSRTGTELTTATAADDVTVDGTLTSSAGRIVNTTRVTVAYTALVTDYMIYADTDGGAYTIDLPAGVEGQYFRIANVGTSGNDATVAPNGAELLLGANVGYALGDGEVLVIIYNATEGWF